MTQGTKRIDARTRKLVAVEAYADERSVERRLAGKEGRPSVDARIDDALRRLHLDHLIPVVVDSEG